jgi:hypothetical protein
MDNNNNNHDDDDDDIQLHELETIEGNLESEQLPNDDAASGFVIVSPSGFMIVSASGFMIV